MQVKESDIELGVGEFVDLFNQTLEFAYPEVVIIGELANFRVSKNRWVYFDLKDEEATVKFFGTVYNLPGPLEDGLLLKVRGQPRLHKLYGFSVNIVNVQLAGEGSIRRAVDLLRAKLMSEGLFDESRKRPLPYPPQHIGLITSKQSAAYADFIKILQARWKGVEVELIDVQVQGELAPGQIVTAIRQFDIQADPPEVLVLIRGGGSPEDLSAFSNEMVTRAVAASRVPSLVAIGHEIDLSLAELAADQRASTPSNAAELLVPDRSQETRELQAATTSLQYAGARHLAVAHDYLAEQSKLLDQQLTLFIQRIHRDLNNASQLLEAFNPVSILRRGYAIVRREGQLIRTKQGLGPGVMIDVQLADGSFAATIEDSDTKGTVHG